MKVCNLEGVCPPLVIKERDACGVCGGDNQSCPTTGPTIGPINGDLSSLQKDSEKNPCIFPLFIIN